MTDKNMRGKNSSSNNPAPNPNPPPSLASRIQSSASGLAKSALQPSTDTNTTLSSNSKSGPSSATASISNASQLGSIPASTGPRQESFRSSSSIPEYEEFQSFPPEMQLEDAYAEQGKGKGKGKERFESAWQSTQSPASATQSQTPAPTHTQPEDGAEVIALLSSPLAEEDPATISESELDPAPLPLSRREREALDKFRLSSDGPRLTGSSLVPDIDTFLSQGVESQGVSGSALRDEVLEKLPGAGDWVGVQERYHEEVWGFLGPVLEAARTEIEEGKEGAAVLRLKMILGHMGG